MEKQLDLNKHDLVMPNMEEIQFINQFTEQFLAAVDKNPGEAKRIIHEIIRPYLSAQLRTIALLEEQVGGYIEQNELLLRSNAQLIHNCKERNVPMPNFDAIQRDYFAQKDERAKLAKGTGIIV